MTGRPAKEIYFVVYDEEQLVVDVEATKAARDAERKRRIARSKPYDEFVKTWTKPAPPDYLPYYGS